MGCVVENKLLKIILYLLIFLIVIVLTPLVLLLIIVLIPIRKCLTLYKSIFLPEYGDILSGMNNILSSDDPYNPNPELNLGCHGWIKGHLRLEDFQELCSRKLKEFDNHSPPWFSELKQYLTTLMGFSVWKNESNFKISDHVKLLEQVDSVAGSMEITEENVADLCFQLNKIPYKNNTSPWEFILHHHVRYKNMDGQGTLGEGQRVTLIVTKFHHSLCDALSILNLLSHIFDQPEAFERFVTKYSKMKSSVSRGQKQNWITKFIYFITFPIMAIHDLINHTFDVWDDNPWHTGWPETRTEFFFTSFDSIKTQRIKKIREGHGQVKFASVCLTALTGGIKRYMTRHDIEVPERLHAAVTVSMPEDTTKLGNNVFGTVVPMPTGLNDRNEIMEFINEGAFAYQKSRIPATMLSLSYAIGMLPKRFVTRIMIFNTCLMTNFPGFDSVLQICGCPLIKIRGFAVLRSTTGIYFFLSGYMGQLDICLGVSKHIMSNMSQVLELREYIEQEFDALENPTNNLIIS